MTVMLIYDYRTFSVKRKLREKDASNYHIQLSLAILLMLIVSLALIALSAENVASLYGGCDGVHLCALLHTGGCDVDGN